MKEEKTQKGHQWTFPFKQLSSPRELPWLAGRTQFPGTAIININISNNNNALNQWLFYMSQALG